MKPEKDTKNGVNGVNDVNDDDDVLLFDLLLDAWDARRTRTSVRLRVLSEVFFSSIVTIKVPHLLLFVFSSVREKTILVENHPITCLPTYHVRTY